MSSPAVVPLNGYMDTQSGQMAYAGQSVSGGNSLIMDKAKEWQMELLMEKLRSKASSLKPLVETAKNMRMAMLDKRFALDNVEKSQLQKCLDTLQHSIKVISLQSMMERLESLSRQLGLKFTPSHHGTEVFISSDMFFVEVQLESTGAVKDVKINHEGKNEHQSCEELVACLSRGDFLDFTAQLEGLISIYQLNAEKKIKTKAFSALQSLEADLSILSQLQNFMKEPFNIVHKSPVGILERRKGGHPMKLTYFVSPYDLIDQESHNCDTLSLETIILKKIGHSITVCLEGSTAHKLPIANIITVNKNLNGKSTPVYATLNSMNSSMLPACFVLKLMKKMPMCMELVRRIQKVTELECTDVSSPQPLLSLIVQHASDGQLDSRNDKGLYVTLPDQQHCYCMTENKSMDGVLIGSIPFTHPAHVPQILVYLRQQALFNTLISSCVRTCARNEVEQSTMFEVSALSWQCISISMEHPFEETIATAEFDLVDISSLKCRLYGVTSGANSEHANDLIGKVLQRCLSIPVTMRTLLKVWDSRTSSGVTCLGSGNNNYNMNLGGTRDENGHNGSAGLPDFGNGDVKIKQEPGTINGNVGRQQQIMPQQQQPQQPIQQTQVQQQSFLDAGAESSIGFPSFSGQSSDTPTAMLNPLQLGALLGQAKAVAAAGASNPASERAKKSRKRKAQDGSWRSPKRKNESDSNEIIVESSSSENSTPLGTPTGRDPQNEARTPTPNSGLDLSNNLDPAGELLDKSSDYDLEPETEVVEVIHETMAPLDDKKERNKKKREDKKSPTSIFEESKSMMSPAVGITPVLNSSYTNQVLSGMGLERRPGIEIIPINPMTQTNIPSTITITPISGPGSNRAIEERKERKSSKNSFFFSQVELILRGCHSITNSNFRNEGLAC